MAHSGRVLRRISRLPVEIAVALYILADSLIAPLLRPVFRWLSGLRLIQRIERAIDGMHPYVVLVLLVVPFGFAELTKVLGVFLMSQGHFRTGMTIFLSAYVVSIVVCERILHAGKRQLMTIPWFALVYNWIMSIKDQIVAWFRGTAVWRFAMHGKERARALLRGVRERLRLPPSSRAKGLYERP